MSAWTPDPSQQAIIGLRRGRHLVLAPPGCGKTQILAERIHFAHAHGVPYDDMLCLTFTNRAARGMRERIGQTVTDGGVGDVFVGNVHRFCSRFLFQNSIVPAESAIIDEETTMSILARYQNEDELLVAQNPSRKRAYSQIVFFSHQMYGIRHGLPRRLRSHPDCVTSEDVAVMKALCKSQGKPFVASAMLDIYDHNDFYRDVAEAETFDPLLRHDAAQLLDKMKYAHAYEAYKRQNCLLDFEDLLLLTYFALKSDTAYKHYPWIQVDEVQDLNLLQLEIIELLSEGSCLIYLGDEQQAIFSFMGAKLATLNVLRDRCEGHIHHLAVNHRSPAYLVNMLNRYATDVLGMTPELLPKPFCDDRVAAHGELAILPSAELHSEYADVARYAKDLAQCYPADKTAVIVNSNQDADEISTQLDKAGLSHFKVSGTDLFSMPEVQLLFAHFSVLANERNFIAWARLLKGLNVCQTNASARQFVHRLEVRGISPVDFLGGDGDTYLRRFTDCYARQDIVVFDTETTGLNVFEDDIVQIAAERIRQGNSIARFSVHIETSRAIPAMLGDVPNPVVEERKHQRLYPHAEALRMFLDFVEDCPLLAHNAAFDYHIMDFNLRRYLPDVGWAKAYPLCWDSLKLIRLLRPDLKAYKLKALLHELGLEGENSHLADEDVFATVSLVKYCFVQAKVLLPSQDEYLSRKDVRHTIKTLRDAYRPLYAHSLTRLYLRKPSGDDPALLSEMRWLYGRLREEGRISEVPKLHYILDFLRGDVVAPDAEPALVEQLSNHIVEMNTFKEADLCGSQSIADRLFVSTIHKAKGLEFDNVIIFDAVDGRIPSFYSQNDPVRMAEDARKLYVAMSRAKSRLYIAFSNSKVTAYGVKPQQLSRFIAPIKDCFQA